MPAGITASLAFLGPTLAPVAADALIGAGIGAGSSALFGGNVGKGALLGGITGGALGFSGPVAGALGGGTAATIGSDVLLGAAGGALGGAVTHGNVGIDALTGAVAGGVTGLASAPGLNSGGGTPLGGEAAGGGAPGAGGAISGATSPAAATAAATAPVDLTSSAIPQSIEGITVTAPALTSSFAPGAVGGAAGALGAITPPAGAGGAKASGEPGTFSSGTVPGFGATRADITGLGATSPALTTAAVPTVAGGGAAAAAPSSFSKFLDHPSLSSGIDVIKNNPSLALGGAVLGYEAANKPSLPSPSATTNTLGQIAGNLNTTGADLMKYITNGGLPPGAKQAIDQATRSAKAAVRSQYASMGLTGSTMETSALGEVDQAAADQTFKIANSLLQTGIQATGTSANIYQEILAAADAQNQQLTSSITNFAAALAGGGIPKAA